MGPIEEEDYGLGSNVSFLPGRAAHFSLSNVFMRRLLQEEHHSGSSDSNEAACESGRTNH